MESQVFNANKKRLTQKVLSIHSIAREPFIFLGFRIFSDGIRKIIEKTLRLRQPLVIFKRKIYIIPKIIPTNLIHGSSAEHQPMVFFL